MLTHKKEIKGMEGCPARERAAEERRSDKTAFGMRGIKKICLQTTARRSIDINERTTASFTVTLADTDTTWL